MLKECFENNARTLWSNYVCLEKVLVNLISNGNNLFCPDNLYSWWTDDVACMTCTCTLYVESFWASTAWLAKKSAPRVHIAPEDKRLLVRNFLKDYFIITASILTCAQVWFDFGCPQNAGQNYWPSLAFISTHSYCIPNVCVFCKFCYPQV